MRIRTLVNNEIHGLRENRAIKDTLRSVDKETTVTYVQLSRMLKHTFLSFVTPSPSLQNSEQPSDKINPATLFRSAAGHLSRAWGSQQPSTDLPQLY